LTTIAYDFRQYDAITTRWR